MNLPEPSEKISSAQAPWSALVVMVVILVAMAALAIYSNVQRWRRAKIETVIVTPVPTPTPDNTP